MHKPEEDNDRHLSNALYFETHRGHPSDFNWYSKHFSTGHRLADLGCGNGRLTKMLLASCRQVVAVDESEEALNSFARTCSVPISSSSLTLLRANLDCLPIDSKFDRIVIAYNTFVCLAHEQRLSLLQWIRGHLLPGGYCLLDFYDGASFLASSDENEIWVAQPELIDEVIVDGETYDVYEKGVAKPGVGQLTMTYEHFRQSDPNETPMASYSITHYPMTLKLFETMYTELGFLCASHYVCRDTDQHYFSLQVNESS